VADKIDVAQQESQCSISLQPDSDIHPANSPMGCIPIDTVFGSIDGDQHGGKEIEGVVGPYWRGLRHQAGGIEVSDVEVHPIGGKGGEVEPIPFGLARVFQAGCLIVTGVPE